MRPPHSRAQATLFEKMDEGFTRSGEGNRSFHVDGIDRASDQVQL